MYSQLQLKSILVPGRKYSSGLAIALWLATQSLLCIPRAMAQSAPAGVTIDNQATGSFVDSKTGSTNNIVSNIVSVTVAEVAGITVVAANTPNSPVPGGTINFDFTITNTGNDPTQFFVPSSPSSISGGTAGAIQIIAYDPDGASGASASVNLTSNNITVPSGGKATGGTGGLLTSLATANNGSIPVGGTITVRIPVTVTATAGNTVSVTLGKTSPANAQNQAYVADGNDLYTVDNADGATGEYAGVPLNGDSTNHRQEASASQSVSVIAATALSISKTTSTPSITAGDSATYTITVTNPNTSGNATNVTITDPLPSGFSYNTTASVNLTGGATRPSTSNPTQGIVIPTWGTFSIPAGGQVAITFTATTDYSTEARLHQNPLTIGLTNSQGQSQTLSYDPTTSTAEDITVASTTPNALTSGLTAPNGTACSVTTRATATINGVINTYYPGTSVSADKKTISVGTATGASSAIQSGDLLLIIQMQDSTLDVSNNAQYGSGSVNNRGSGVTNLNNAGAYEYSIAASNLSGGTVSLQAALVNTYVNSNATGTAGQQRFQVIRVPQYQDATISTAVTALPWNGSTGGVIALDVAGTLTFSGGKLVATGAGFRGGGGTNTTGSGSAPVGGFRDYVRLSSTLLHGSKGEGIAGTPRYTRTAVSIDASGTVTAGTSVTDNTTEGYPNGSMGRGAPGNGGGGGTDPQSTNAANTGGGGGSNVGAGGKGGDSWYDGFGRQPLGGLGGTALPTSVNRIFMGGGGGAATANDSTSAPVPSGGSGGGIILVRAGTITGSGSLEANGVAGVAPSSTDGGGAGGAGGSILIKATNASTPTLSLTAAGGNGNNSGYFSHGPGGGGGGGYIAYQGFSPASTVVTGGTPGNDVAGSGNPYLPNVPPDPAPNASADPYGAVSGTNGKAEGAVIPTAGVSFGASCSGTASVLLVKRITSINGAAVSSGGDDLASYTQQDANPYDDNVIEPSLAPSLPTYPVADTNKWPNTTGKTSSTFLIGGINGGRTRPGDEVEYTIYFLSSGTVAATNVKFCDRVPTKQTFVPNAFNGLPAASGGDGSDRGIAVSYNGTYSSSTNTSDGDTARYYERGVVPLPAVCGGDLNSNPTGAIVVNLGQGATSSVGGSIPKATTTPNTDATTYGFVRFKAKVD